MSNNIIVDEFKDREARVEKEISRINYYINNNKRTHFKINMIKHFRKGTQMFRLAMPYLLSLCLATGFFAETTDGLPFSNKRKKYANYVTSFDDTGKVSNMKTYSYMKLENTYIRYYGAWTKNANDGYSRTVKTYVIDSETIDKLSSLADKDVLYIYDIFEEPTKVIIEEKKTLTEEELSQEPYFDGVIYQEDKNDYVVYEMPAGKNILLSFFYLLSVLIFALLAYYAQSEIWEARGYNYEEEIKDIDECAKTDHNFYSKERLQESLQEKIKELEKIRLDIDKIISALESNQKGASLTLR